MTAGLSLAEMQEHYRLRQMAGTTGGGALNPLPAQGPKPVRVRPLQLDGKDSRPRAAGRDPCPYCETRGDLGCDHFAPCAPVDLPREGQGVAFEKAASSGRAGVTARRFTEDEDRRLLALRAEGLNSQQVAAQLGRDRSSVYSAIDRLRHAGKLADG